MNIAVSTIIFRDRPLSEALRIISDLGIGAVELWGGDSHLPAEPGQDRFDIIRRAAEELGLRMIGVGSYIGNFSELQEADGLKELEVLKKYMETISRLGIDWVRVSSGGPHAFRATEADYEKAAVWLQRTADVAKSYGKQIVMEMHNGSLIETAEAALHLLHLIDRPEVGLIHDAGNMYITDTDYGHHSVQLLGKKIFHVHVKGERRVHDERLPATFYNETKHGRELFQQALLEEGEVDHYPTFQALHRIGYTGYLTLESHAPYPDVERTRRDKEEVERLLQRIAMEESR